MQSLLEPITQTLNYGDLPETWCVPDIERFSAEKTLYDYQTDALQKAARALFLYYGKEHDWISGEPQSVNSERKRSFANLYGSHGIEDLKRYKNRTDERNGDQNQVYRILSDYIVPLGDLISYHNLMNRMCFWMATGSGKTLVMVKLIEYLHSLKKHGEIPPYNILILAPGDHLLRQIWRTVDEFNSSGLHIDLVPLREVHGTRQGRLGDCATVYYHRSDNVSDVHKEALTDYRAYENGGKWYVILDEAHKGSGEESKRQAYYAVMAREGFLFNFSATFTDKEDIVTTVKKYNLEEFIKNGHGKNIYLNEQEFNAFINRGEEISRDERKKIVLKSLVTLAYVSRCVSTLRKDTGLENLYHLPLMLTLVNSVNTDNERNDLWAFFQTLREIASGEIEKSLFKDVKKELIAEWKNATLFLGQDEGGIIGTDETSIKEMTIAGLREAVFLNRRKGGLQFICGSDNKELAFQMKNADSPFALIRIGATSKWRKDILAGYEETTGLREKPFFDELEKSPITILMGSRSFFESWDSNRPNVINFINIGGRDAKKFVVQSVGRGVRIEPLKGKRRRLEYLLPTLGRREKTVLKRCQDQTIFPETLFIFATNRKAFETVLKGVQAEKSSAFERLDIFEKAPAPKIGNKNVPLLIPEYKETQEDSIKSPFYMSDQTLQRFKEWLERTSDSVFMVRDSLAMPQITALRSAASKKVEIEQEKDYAMIPFLQNRLMAHLSKTEKISDSVRKLDDKDIVHFRHIQIDSEYAIDFKDKVNMVKEGRRSDKEMSELTEQLVKGKIAREAFNDKVLGKDEEIFKGLKIKRLLGHYYLPVVWTPEKKNFIRHVIKVKSEIQFLEKLESWTRQGGVEWDAWMFSKIDEFLDNVHIPYFDADKNDYCRFLPDFVFWMCKKNKYRIVFVDPKGEAHTASYRKIDGYKKIFLENDKVRTFKHRNWVVSVDLFFYNERATPLESYKNYWIREPSPIFADRVA